MAQYLSQKELVKLIETNLNNLESGTLGLSEIEKHLDLVRELYERTIAFRYKAFEHHSSVEVITPEREEIIPVIEAQEIHQEETFSEQEVIEEIVIEEPNEDAEPEIEFDFFSPADTITEEIVIKENTPSPTFTPEKEEIIVERIQQEEEAKTWNESHVEQSEPETENTPSSGGFTKRVFKIEQEIKNQFGFHSLQTLVGSFGLNERLLYINELFDGSSESFSDAIKHLDSRPNLSEAATYIEEIGNKFNWDIESETVEEFIQKLCRRYA